VGLDPPSQRVSTPLGVWELSDPKPVTPSQLCDSGHLSLALETRQAKPSVFFQGQGGLTLTMHLLCACYSSLQSPDGPGRVLDTFSCVGKESACFCALRSSQVQC
jgi:hypothetical protein